MASQEARCPERAHRNACGRAAKKACAGAKAGGCAPAQFVDVGLERLREVDEHVRGFLRNASTR